MALIYVNKGFQDIRDLGREEVLSQLKAQTLANIIMYKVNENT